MYRRTGHKELFVNHRSIAGFVALVCALSPLTAFAAAANTANVNLPAGTPMSVHITSKISSRTAGVGDRFTFEVIRDVRSDGWLVIPAGAQGSGEVMSVERAAFNGQPGELGLQFDYVSAVDGNKVVIAKTSIAAEGKLKSGAAAHKWGMGHEASIRSTTVFSISVGNTVGIAAVDHFANTGVTAH
jgi:hypothetical protein